FEYRAFVEVVQDFRKLPVGQADVVVLFKLRPEVGDECGFIFDRNKGIAQSNQLLYQVVFQYLFRFAAHYTNICWRRPFLNLLTSTICVSMAWILSSRLAKNWAILFCSSIH